MSWVVLYLLVREEVCYSDFISDRNFGTVFALPIKIVNERRCEK
jgi:hypothetical protein